MLRCFRRQPIYFLHGILKQISFVKIWCFGAAGLFISALFSAERCDTIRGFLRFDPKSKLSEFYALPAGVVGVISAFNVPVAVWSWTAALALACGDSVVWKPSEKTPLTALACQAIFARAAKRFGVSVVNGFTGSSIWHLLYSFPPVPGKMIDDGFKLFAGDMARTFAVEFDYIDVHDQRTEDQMRVMARQTVLPLVRLIESLQAAGIYDRTLIAIYSLDGGRSPAAASYGNEGKNTVILAGGMIEGGYYGDISVASDTANGHRYQYHIPDIATGQPGAVVQDNSGRIPGASIWRTVMKALGMPEAMYSQFPDVQGHQHLPWLLKS